MVNMKNTVLITGATSGLGLSYAKYFASAGYDLILTGRRREIIQKNAETLQKRYHIKAEVLIVELSDPNGISHLLSCIRDRDIHVLVNNAGFGLKPFFADTPQKDIEKMLYLQILCVTQLTHCVLKGMLQRHDGIIINISSDGAFAVMPHNVLYSSTKLYILNFTEGLHTELVGTGVHVQAVCPGFIDSHFHENAGMHMDKNKKGLFGFRQPDDIVADAMKDFRKGKVVSVPDTGAKLIRFMGRFMPRKAFYKMSASFSAGVIKKKANTSASHK